MNPYVQLFDGLSREGPGEFYDVEWAFKLAGLKPDALMCDVACGSGADTTALLRLAPQGHVTAFDKQPDFLELARAANGSNPRTTISVGDMNDPLAGGPFDLIWCAGAVYFAGIKQMLDTWRPALAPNGAVAFSEICWWKDKPGSKARQFWGREFPAMSDEAGIKAQITAAGYEVIGTRRVSEPEWSRYYEDLQYRTDCLRETAKTDTALADVLKETQEEIEVWNACRGEFGYLVTLARPV